MNKLTKTQNDQINAFRTAFEAGLDKIAEASEIYVSVIDEDHSMKHQFAKAFELTIPAGAWSGLEAVGRKQMHPRVMLGVGRNTGFIKRLPYSDQESIINGEKVDLLIVGGDSVMVDPRTVSMLQSKQLFAGNHIRTLAEQKEFLENCKRVDEDAKVEKAKVIRYRIEKGVVHFCADTVFTMEEMIAITAEISRNK